jgi:hypothetical protein
MTHIKVNPSRISQESPVSRRFIMPSMVPIEYAPPLDMKNMIAQAVGQRGWRLVRTVFIDEQAVLGFQPENPIQHVMS